MLRLAALMWQPDLNEPFKAMIESINSFYAKGADAVTLIEVRMSVQNILTNCGAR